MDLLVLTIASFVFLGLSRAAQLDSSTNAKILKYDYKNDAAGHYYFEYATSDGQSRDEKGDLNNPDSKYPEMVVSGSYSFTGADGVVYTVRYTADKDGFHPEGDHIKVPPYTPWPINQNRNDIDDNPTDDRFKLYRPPQYDSTNDGDSIRKVIISTPPPLYPPPQKPHVPSNIFNDSNDNVIISTPTPSVTNAYIPSSPSRTYLDQNPNSSKDVSRAYIPSTPGPFRAVFGDSHLGAGSSQVRVTKRVNKRPVKA